MSGLSKIVGLEIATFLGSLFVIVAVQLLTGRINTRGLLFARFPDGELRFSPARVQLLIASIAGAFSYVATVADSFSLQVIPPVPNEWLEVLGGSNGLYLVHKAYLTFISKVAP